MVGGGREEERKREREFYLKIEGLHSIMPKGCTELIHDEGTMPGNRYIKEISTSSCETMASRCKRFFRFYGR